MKIRLRDGTGVIDLRYLCEDTDRHGNVRIYVRRHGRKIRIREQPGTDEFFAAYRAALEGMRVEAESSGRAQSGSLRWLVERYYQSDAFARLGDGTRRVRRRLLDGLCLDRFDNEPCHGDKPFAKMRAKHVRRLRDQKAGLPEAANARVKALRQVFAWATAADVGLADHNPARDVAYIRTASDGHHTWTVEEIRRYGARHPIGGKARLALALLLFTGVRRSDVVQLGRQNERDGWLHFTETKGRSQLVKDRAIPILPELRAAIDACPSGHLTYLVTEFGKPYTANGFGNWFRRRCDEAGLPHCSAHGLRKAGATIAAENGATEHQLMSIYGWESPKQAALYTRQADRKRLVREAMHKLVPDQNENESVPPSSVVAPGGTNRAKKP